MKSGKIFTLIKEYVLMIVGMFLYSFGWIGCIVPAGGVGGGAAGFSFILCTALNNFLGIEVQLGTMVFIINAILLVAAGFIVGWNFGFKTLFTVAFMSVALNFWQTLLEGVNLFEGLDPVLAVILGGMFSGAGVALAFMQGGSTGGVDIIAMIINKYRTVSYGKILRYVDGTVIASSLLVGYGMAAVIYGFIMTAVIGYTVDMLMSGNQQSNQVFIFSKDFEKIRAMLIENAHRGVTLLRSEGGYTREESMVVMMVCRKRETSNVLKLVKEIDPNAFISVGSVMGVYGRGFEALSKI
ncbi:MAG: YitT family protein [Rikenellaceae bacterium]|nr:YitT family protein [Rikenellaceae bacterium]